MECPICYDKVFENDKIIQHCCGQIFHKKCLTFWFLKKKKETCCPFCRTSCNFNSNKIKVELYSKPLTRSRYAMFEKIYCNDVQKALNKCELQRNREEKTQAMIEVMRTVFEHPQVLINKSVFNKTVKKKIDELIVENMKNKFIINKETYYRATEILESVNHIYKTYLSDFK